MMARRESWARLVRGDVTPARHLETARAVAANARGAPRRIGRRLRGRPPGTNPVASLFDGLRKAGKHVTLVFTTDEPLLDEMRATRHGDFAAWPNLQVREIDTAIEAHTLVPLPAQRRTNEILDEALAAARGQGRRPG